MLEGVHSSSCSARPKTLHNNYHINIDKKSWQHYDNSDRLWLENNACTHATGVIHKRLAGLPCFACILFYFYFRDSLLFSRGVPIYATQHSSLQKSKMLKLPACQPRVQLHRHHAQCHVCYDSALQTPDPRPARLFNSRRRHQNQQKYAPLL